MSIKVPSIMDLTEGEIDLIETINAGAYGPTHALIVQYSMLGWTVTGTGYEHSLSITARVAMYLVNQINLRCNHPELAEVA